MRALSEQSNLAELDAVDSELVRHSLLNSVDPRKHPNLSVI
jgi:hypothetical protein